MEMLEMEIEKSNVSVSVKSELLKMLKNKERLNMDLLSNEKLVELLELLG